MPRKAIKGGKLNRNLMIGLGLLVLVAVIVVVSLFAAGVFKKKTADPDAVLEKATGLVPIAEFEESADRFQGTSAFLCGKNITIEQPENFDISVYNMKYAKDNKSGELYDQLYNLFGDETEDFFGYLTEGGLLSGISQDPSVVINAAKKIATGDWKTNPDKIVKLMQLFYLMYNDANPVFDDGVAYIIKYNNILYLVFNPENPCSNIDQFIKNSKDSISSGNMESFMVNFIEFADSYLNTEQVYINSYGYGGISQPGSR